MIKLNPAQLIRKKQEIPGCFPESIGKINWERFENTWFPMPFFLHNGKQSEFGPTNWCRFKLIPVESSGRSRKYNILLAFDTRSCFEEEEFEEEDLNETPVFTNASEKLKYYALCDNEYKLISCCSEAFKCDWVDKYILKKFHVTETNNINDLRLQNQN
ncbi:MAG: virulence factor SrfB [Haliscomenobacter sp.]|nr:virulence factor SrfB [Haliscomenobacter sp.]